MMDIFLTLITGLGLGSIITIILNYYLEKYKLRKNKYYEEKKNCYFGLLTALHKAAVEPSDKNSKEFAYYQTIASLFAPDDVVKYIQEMIDTNEDREGRDIAFKNLIFSMRKDLNEFI